MTAEDVVPSNTVGSGLPDPSQVGWDQHFGYGRPDLGLAMQRINEGKIPPQALITSPDWFAPLNLERQNRVTINADLSANRAQLASGKRYDWRLQWAPGIEPCESDFRTVAHGARRERADRDARDDRPHGRPQRARRAHDELLVRQPAPAGDRRLHPRPDRPGEGPRRRRPERAGVHGSGGGDRHRRKPWRGSQGAVRLRRSAPSIRAGRARSPAIRTRPAGRRPAARSRSGCTT